MCFDIKDFSFAYPNQEKKALKNIDLQVMQGEFLSICGPSGCGKSTLLRQLKSVLAPHGQRSGEIYFEGRRLGEVDQRDQSGRIGFVMQNPDNQIVTDKVWHELAFGLESLGYDTATIRARVAEMSSYFGIESWFYKNVTELSGGQKQLLNLASIMAMQPSVLILDEPTSQLDPIAASEFLATISKINREMGTTIIITEHRLEEVFPMSDRVLVIDQGQIISQGSPSDVGDQLKAQGHEMFQAMPTPMRIFAAVPNALQCPVTVRDGRLWLSDYAKHHPLLPVPIKEKQAPKTRPVLTIKEAWFKYEKDSPDVIKGLSMEVAQGEFLAILGGNGTGKSTTLSLLAGRNKPYRGKILHHSPEDVLATLPQNPQALFVKKTVGEDLMEVLGSKKINRERQALREEKLAEVIKLCRLEELQDRHPFDLSGGEQQRAALAKVLLLEPQILLLDEPTKGLDAEFKEVFAEILKDLLAKGVTILMVSHDIEFCAKHAHRCALFFDGNLVTENEPQEFFSGNSFYTTAANRMARHLLAGAVTAEDVITACGGQENTHPLLRQEEKIEEKIKKSSNKININNNRELIKNETTNPRPEDTKNRKQPIANEQVAVEDRKLSKRTLAATLMILLAIPLTIYVGIYYLGDRKYYFISLLIMLETMLPFFLIFEGRKPQARELIIIAVLCAIGVAGRAAFFMLPQFKPIAALVIIAGVAFGGETGFLVGAVTMMVSNIMFGQGPWTPWQMFAMGLIGFFAGVLFQKGWLLRSRIPLCIYGGLAVLLIYGGLMNPASVLMYSTNPTLPMFLSAYLMGLPFDLIHAGSTVIFLWFISRPMLEKLDRIKVKYGLI